MTTDERDRESIQKMLSENGQLQRHAGINVEDIMPLLQSVRAEYAVALRRVEWVISDDWEWLACPVCATQHAMDSTRNKRDLTHKEDCVLKRLLGDA